MRNPQGYAQIIDPALASPVEFDTVTCIHCGQIGMTRSPGGKLEVMVFRADGSHYMLEAGFCRSCMQVVCPKCSGKPCNNRFRRLDGEEKAAQRLICF